MRRIAVALLAALAAAALPACPSKQDACSVDHEKHVVADVAASWYLRPDLLASVNPDSYPDSQSLLTALVAPAVQAGQDRGWSFITTVQQQQQYYGAGESVGFGIGFLYRRDTSNVLHFRVSQVIESSAAWSAGFARGDDILAIGDTETTLVPIGDLIAAGTVSQALGPSEPGVTRWFSVQPVGTTANPVTRTMTKGVYDIHPVAYSGTIPSTVLGRNVGVVVFRAFVSTANTALATAIGNFRTSGITDVIVDLRYNGGGLVSTAQLLANLLGGGLSGTMYDLVNNGYHTDLDAHAAFAPTAQSMTPTKVAFVTTGASASASELVPNVLEPYLAPSSPPGVAPRIALVGAKTYGKPVGQRGFTITECGKVLYLVSFALLNKDGEGRYFAGLPDTNNPPDFGGRFCTMTDDLEHEMGAPAELSTAAALSWIETGTCPPAPAALVRAAPDEYPRAENPTIAQIENPGLF